jgi:hypothetical protein
MSFEKIKSFLWFGIKVWAAMSVFWFIVGYLPEGIRNFAIDPIGAVKNKVTS